MSLDSHTTQRTSSIEIDTNPLDVEVIIEAGIAVEATFRIPVIAPTKEKAAQRAQETALVMFRQAWDLLPISFARAMRDALGDSVDGLKIAAMIPGEEPEVFVDNGASSDECA